MRLASAFPGAEIRTSPMALREIFFDLRPRGERQDAAPDFVADAQWLAGADLVILKGTYDGSVRRTLEIHDVPLSGARAER